jgi:betaine lipid synthase
MYASTWICTKEVGLEKEDMKTRLRQANLAELELEGPAMHMDE